MYKRQVYDYLSGVVIITLGVLVFAGLLLHYQTGLNENIQEAAMQYGIINLHENMVSLANERLTVYLIAYYIILVLLYTFLTFFVTITKNAIAGVIFAGVFGGSFYGFFGELFYDFYYELVLQRDIVSPLEVMERLERNGCTTVDTSFWEVMGIYVAIIMILIVGIYVVAKTKDLSRGKIFCSNLMELAFILLLFILGAIVIGELIGIFWPFSMGLGMMSGGVAYYFTTKPKKMTEVWEVK